jgi:putative addiction module antidote
MTTLKLIAVGNSTGIILPKEMLEKLRVQRGDEIQFLEEPDGFHLTQYNAVLAQQFAVAERVMREDRDILRKLAE